MNGGPIAPLHSERADGSSEPREAIEAPFTIHPSPSRPGVEIPLPVRRQRGALDGVGDATLKGRLEFRARAINHDRVPRTLGAERVRHPGGDDEPGIVRPALVVALDEETHHAPRHSGALIHEDELHIALHEKHRVPLLAIIRAQREVLRLRRKQPLEPLLGRRVRGDVRRVDVKAFRRAGKHPRRGPLARPETDLSQHAIPLSRKLAKEPAMPLGKNPAGEKLDSGNPRGVEFLAFGDQFAGFHAGRGQARSERTAGVIPLRELREGVGFQGVPEVGHAAESSQFRLLVDFANSLQRKDLCFAACLEMQ